MSRVKGTSLESVSRLALLSVSDRSFANCISVFLRYGPGVLESLQFRGAHYSPEFSAA